LFFGPYIGGDNYTIAPKQSGDRKTNIKYLSIFLYYMLWAIILLFNLEIEAKENIKVNSSKIFGRNA
jgi:hypothetical protein